ncbi:sugar ABC transporter ATP-binding protein [Cohnella xylanilytica]|uniref:Carbohydrate ABC transporter permease n=1 Tax=Cohnella xylanilytica TaxID=557555 RepID=A0A841UCI2_9BACL|nr:carbohydrate ABC transporter permease [Cohnella xylanilytica]MBB6695651.1 carbohydrate ABC transporter permease [Cohnella xylanilytica]GIO14009.1 sugar ABC transporter ATP-binding protein [Cohnella xylanilytica]
MAKRKSLPVRLVVYLVLVAIAVVDFYPVVYMAVNSSRTAVDFFRDPGGLPAPWYFDNFKALYYRFDVLRLFGNTLGDTAAAFALAMALSIPASFAFAKIRFRYRSGLYMTVIATMTIPGITFVVPNFLLMSRLGLVDHPASVVIMWAVTSVPSNIFLLVALMRGIPDEILEAAKVDGISYVQTVARIVLPLSVPGIVTLAIFNTTGWWNDLFTPLIFLQSDEWKTMTVAVATILKRFDTDYPLLLAGLFMTSVPPMLIYVALQKYIKRGLVIGSVK